MPKIIKYLIIIFASLIVITGLAIGTAIWFVFTPEKLTPIVLKQSKDFIKCQTNLESVELTFFSTFPQFGLKINQVSLVNPTPGAENDTLFKAQALTGVVDIKTFWDKNELIINELIINNGSINIFSDSLGLTNYNITVPDTSANESSSKPIDFIDLKNIELGNIKISYKDDALKFKTELNQLTAHLNATIFSDSINADLKMSPTKVWLEYEGEKYLQGDTVELDCPSQFIPSKLLFHFNNANAIINRLPINVDGTFAMDSIYENFDMKLTYDFENWPIAKALQLTPPSYLHYLTDIQTSGLLSSNGKITGLYNDSTMPLIDVNVKLSNGTYQQKGLPLAIKDMNGNIDFYSDLKNDTISFLKINHFDAKTAQSTFSTSGKIDHLFSDVHINLNSNANVFLAEITPLLPTSLKTTLTGRASGNVKSILTMQQIEKMQLEKMQLSGNLAFTDMAVKYDSVSLKTDLTSLIFALPNKTTINKNSSFASISLSSKNLEANKIDGFESKLQNAIINLETSDLRDSTIVPTLNLSYQFDSINAKIDTSTFAIKNPKGNVLLSPRKGFKTQPHIVLNLKSNSLQASAGKDLLTVDNIDLTTNIENDESQKEVFLRWLTEGYLHLENGTISLASFNYPIKIPSIKMNFSPENFNIADGTVIIDKSDYKLTGKVENILSYFRNDSLLRANFYFTSNYINLSQLMALSNGFGDETPDTTSSSGPYMVPKGIAFNLNTNVKMATIGSDTITNITGNVVVKDGVLLLDKIQCVTPATEIDLTVMYRTLRKNHLYLGLDYKMHNIKIEKLLKTIPDIDSMMPMLRDFRGTAEYKIVGETYLDSSYNMKISTVRAASSIKGKDLVLMDGPTFDELSKQLKFNKKTVNKIDSLSAEFTIFKDEIDIYPFLIVMDKYKAIVAGQHTLDNKFAYHISVVDCPLPIKLGVNVKGNIENLNYNLTQCQYAELYRPVAQKKVENEQQLLQKRIKDMLEGKVAF